MSLLEEQIVMPFPTHSFLCHSETARHKLYVLLANSSLISADVTSTAQIPLQKRIIKNTVTYHKTESEISMDKDYICVYHYSCQLQKALVLSLFVKPFTSPVLWYKKWNKSISITGKPDIFFNGVQSCLTVNFKMFPLNSVICFHHIKNCGKVNLHGVILMMT